MSSLFYRNKDQQSRNSRNPLSDSSPTSNSAISNSLRHERLSRLNSSGSADGSKDKAVSHAESYLSRRENRLSARKKAEEESGTNDYKKMYEEALTTNERLKSRLVGSKQELVLVHTQMEKVAQKKARVTDSCRSNILETEKKERRVLEKKISEMEEELKVQTDLKMENQRLKDENGALIRVISKLSK